MAFFIDTHSHFDAGEFEAEAVELARAEGVVLVPDPPTWTQYWWRLQHEHPEVARRVRAEVVGRVLDRERVTVAAAVGIRARTAMEWLKMAYNATGTTLYEAIHNQPGYYGITAPPTLWHRYITEDVPMSLVPIAALGRRYGVAVSGIDSIIRLACVVHQTDYWRRGRTLDKLGIEQLSVDELNQLVLGGEA